MRERVELHLVAARGRSLSLRAALFGIVCAALFTNIGFWAAIVGVGSFAESVSLAVIGSWVLLAAAILAAAVFHWLRVVGTRT